MNLKNYSFTFNPDKKGLHKILGVLEAEIMEILWKRKKMTVHEVHKKIQARRPIAYTTVMTVMSRLAEKGLLERVKEGGAFIYRTTLSKEQFTSLTLKKIINEIVEDFSTPALSYFVELLEDTHSDKIAGLAKLVEQKRRDKNV